MRCLFICVMLGRSQSKLHFYYLLSNTKFHQNRFSNSEDETCGRKDKYDLHIMGSYMYFIQIKSKSTFLTGDPRVPDSGRSLGFGTTTVCVVQLEKTSPVYRSKHSNIGHSCIHMCIINFVPLLFMCVLR